MAKKSGPISAFIHTTIREVKGQEVAKITLHLSRTISQEQCSL